MRISVCAASTFFLLGQGSWAAQPSSLPPVPAPLRELPWGQLNFLHTTDTHGWLAGHLQEWVDFLRLGRVQLTPVFRPSYGADWGDYISFAERLHEKADADGSDLLLIDTGDRIEGNGLYDAADPKGKYLLNIFGQQEIDVLCAGNHELYKNRSSYDEYEITAPNSHGNYLASNIDIIDPETGELKPLAQRYRKFTTKNQGIRVLAFGFLYDFNLGSNNTVVQAVEDTIKEEWFQNAIRDRDVDLFLVIGHVPLRTMEFKNIFTAIRKQNWDVPIQFFGGHLHVRDYAKYDNKAYAMESGRYMETIGFASVSGLNAGGKASMTHPQMQNLVPMAPLRRQAPRFGRRYIDNNLFSFFRHTDLNETTFPTAHGRNVSNQIAEDRTALKLDYKYGCAPKTFWTSRAPFPSDDSVFTWLQDQVLPDSILDAKRGDKPRIVITNTGAIRFDIFEGPFTLNSLFTVSPFTGGFRYIKDVPLEIAKKLVVVLNQVDQIAPVAFKTPGENADEAIPAAGAGRISDQQVELSHDDSENLLPGYTTFDDAGSDGDDTKHITTKFYKVPNCMESRVSFPKQSSSSEDPATVDLVYVAFIERYVLLALRFLGTDYSSPDTGEYMAGKELTSIIRDWIQDHWAC